MLLLALGLAMDSFSVSICSGTVLRGPRLPQALSIGLVMGGFQAIMPVVGWLGGATFGAVIGGFDHWLAFGLLALIGGRMIWEALHGDDETNLLDASSWRVLLGLGIATSIDALAVGLTLAFLQVSIAVPIAVIGGVAFGLSFAGVLLGCHAGHLLRDRVPILGGLMLVGIGVKVLVEHLAPALGI